VPAAPPMPFDPIEEGRRQWAEAGWPDAAPGMGVVGSVLRVQQLFLVAVEDVLAPFELRFARYQALLLLLFSRRGRVPMGTLAQRLQVHSATVTNVVNRLEDQGLVRREAHPADARSALAALTPRGRRVALAATEALRSQVLDPVPLTEREAARLSVLLRRQRLHAGDFVVPGRRLAPPGAGPGWGREPLPFDPIAEAREQWARAGWSDAGLGVEVVASVFRVGQIYLNDLERTLRPLDLSFARYEALMLLLFARTQRLPMGKLSARLQVHPASVTNAIKRLQDEGLIRRDTNPDDRRSSFATLTPAGHRAVLRATEAVRAEVLTDVGLTERQCEEEFRLLRKVRVAFGDFTPSTDPRPPRPDLRGAPPRLRR